MNTLHEITGDYLKLYEMLSDPEYADFEEAVKETLDLRSEDFEQKAQNIAIVIKQLEADAAAVETEENRLKQRGGSFKNNAKRLKETLEQAMIAVGKPKFKTRLFTFYIGKNAPGVNDYDPGQIPGKYFIPQEPRLDKITLMADMKAGIEVPGAAIHQSESLKIR